MEQEPIKLDELEKFGRFLFHFCRVERATYHEDGLRKETDADHTVTLVIVACALAERLYPALDRGLMAQYATVHDANEGFDGDTNSFALSAAERSEKKAREKNAIERIASEFPFFPWLSEMIDRYEALSDRESRFVKLIDKMMPKLTHILNKGAAYKKTGRTRTEVETFLDEQYVEIAATYGKEFPKVLDLFRKLNREVVRVTLE